MLYKKVHKAEEVKDLDFYTFSYYYDRAAEVGLIGTVAPASFHFKFTSCGRNGNTYAHHDALLSCRGS